MNLVRDAAKRRAVKEITEDYWHMGIMCVLAMQFYAISSGGYATGAVRYAFFLIFLFLLKKEMRHHENFRLVDK